MSNTNIISLLDIVDFSIRIDEFEVEYTGNKVFSEICFI